MYIKAINTMFMRETNIECFIFMYRLPSKLLIRGWVIAPSIIEVIPKIRKPVDPPYTILSNRDDKGSI